MTLVGLLLACRDPGGPPAPADGDPPVHATHTGDTAIHDDTGELPPFDGPLLLSETGLYADLGSRTLAPGVRPYEIAWPLWSDGSDKARYLLVPDGEAIDTSDMDRWVFPVGTAAFKEFRVGGATVETRMLRKEPGGWTMVAYLWRADGSDADAVPLGEPDAGGTTHDVPPRGSCHRCHDGTSDVLAGVGAIQLGSGGATLGAWAAEGLLSEPPAGPIDVPGSGEVRAALGYLHGNCGSCHVDTSRIFQGPGTSPIRLDVAVGLSAPDQADAAVTTIGQAAVHAMLGTTVVVVPGEPEASQLWVRMGVRGDLGMPPVGSEVVDDPALDAIAAWIRGL